VYHQNLWGALKSGPGSSIEATESVREDLQAQIRHLFKSETPITLVDAACGDMTWMPVLLEMLAVKYGYSIRYAGIDIVEELICANRARLVDTVDIKYSFQNLDLTKDVLPKGDLILCKDLINHLCFKDIWKILDNMNKSGSSYLIISSNRGHENFDPGVMKGNESRHVDLEADPFSLEKPIWSNSYLCLWKLPLELPVQVSGT
jgi:2-polyprenyl-3-methyl-5-hydroxy-6-metoxy-1,4-benzoquinol methylase